MLKIKLDFSGNLKNDGTLIEYKFDNFDGFSNIIKNRQDYYKKIYYKIENIEHTNIKGNYLIYVARRFHIYDGDTTKTKIGNGWLINTTENMNNFNPKLVYYNKLVDRVQDVKRRQIITGDFNTNINIFGYTEQLDVEQSIVFEKKIFQYVNKTSVDNGTISTNDMKSIFPTYLVHNLDSFNKRFLFEKYLAKFII